MNKNVWELRTSCKKNLTIRSNLDYFNNRFDGRSMANSWVVPDIRIQGKSLRFRDFISWLPTAPVVSSKAKEVLPELLEPYCEFFLLISLRKKSYFATNVIKLVDCLDMKKSEIIFFEDDPTEILMINRHIFMQEKIPDIPIFKIPQDPETVFVTKKFIDCVISNKLTGAAFSRPEEDQLVRLVHGEPINVVPGVLD